MKNWILLFLCFFILSCQTKKPVLPPPERNYIQTTKSDVIIKNDCWNARFSPRGDQIVYICQKRPESPQLFIEDLNTGLVRQISFQTGDLKSPRFIKPEWLVYLSNSDSQKENISRLLFDAEKNPQAAEPIFDVFSFELDKDELERITSDESVQMIVPIKSKDSKVAFIKKKKSTWQVGLKNLQNLSEKILYSGSYPIDEVVPGDFNQIMFVEDLGNKKWIRLIIDDSKQSAWPEIKGKVKNFSFDPNTQDIEYLDLNEEIPKLKVLSTKNLCATDVFSFPNGTTEISKSPLSDQLFVITRELEGLKKIEKIVVERNPARPCKKVVLRR